MKKKKKIYIVGKGRIGGSYCDSFWTVAEDGTVGYFLDRYPTEEERVAILRDIKRHKEQLVSQLRDLKKAEKVLNGKVQR